MIKLILCLAFLSCTAFLGNSFSLRLKRRSKYLGAFIESLSRMKTLICFGGFDIKRVIEEAFSSSEELCSSFANPETFEEQLSSWWDKCVDSLPKSSGLNPEDRDIIKRFGAGLGISDVEGQIQNCELYSDLIRERLNLSKADEATKCRLYQILGVSLGSLVTLLIL
ncbi:MAG: stage III sporulation protein AB [Ruminococcus sp.]